MLNEIMVGMMIVVLIVIFAAFAWDVYKSLPKDNNHAAK